MQILEKYKHMDLEFGLNSLSLLNLFIYFSLRFVLVYFIFILWTRKILVFCVEVDEVWAEKQLAGNIYYDTV
jgi:hypothetical protein